MKKAFTLVELMILITILGLLAGWLGNELARSDEKKVPGRTATVPTSVTVIEPTE